MTKHPLVLVALAYVAALLVAPWVTLPSTALWAVAAGAALAALVTACCSKPRWLTAAAVLVCVSGLGMLRQRAESALPSDHVALLPQRVPLTLEGVVADPPEERLRTTHVVVEATGVTSADGRRRHCRGRVLVATDRRALRPGDGRRNAFTGQVGDVVRFPISLSPVAPATNPGEFCRACVDRRAGIRVFGFVQGGRLRVVGTPQELTPKRLAADMRSRISQALSVSSESGGAGQPDGLVPRLESSILYGMHAAPIPENIEESFRRSGTIHLLVVSGTQVALIVVFLLAVTSLVPRWVRLLVIAPVLVFYLFVTLQPPSIIRASIMGFVAVLAILSGRDFDPLNALALAGLLILSARPGDLHDLGLQLSFAACMGIILLTPKLMRLLSSLPRPVAFLVGATTGAQLGVAPALAYHFGTVPVVGFVANLIAIPTAALLLGTGVGTCAASVVSDPMTRVIGRAGHVLTVILMRNAGFFGHQPFATLDVRPTHPLSLIVGYGVLAALVAVDGPAVRRWLSRERVLTLTAVVATLTLGWLTYDHLRPRELTVTFLDVGQGDAIVIRSPTGKTVLIDGGSHDRAFRDVGERVIAPYLAEVGVKKLDAILVTHPHEDHVNGLATVVQQVGAKLILDLQQPAGSCSAYEAFLALVRREGVRVERLKRRQALDLGGGAKLWVLWPSESSVQGTRDDENNNSAVVKLAFGETSFLLAADLRTEGERFLMDYGDDLRSAVLKAGHHGGPGTTSDEFLERVSPEACVLSVGRNNTFGHPDEETVRRLRQHDVRVYRTDLDGAVTFRTDGRRLRVSTFRSRHRHDLLPGRAKARERSSDGSD
jgi:competence protein ComEC